MLLKGPMVSSISHVGKHFWTCNLSNTAGNWKVRIRRHRLHDWVITVDNKDSLGMIFPIPGNIYQQYLPFKSLGPGVVSYFCVNRFISVLGNGLVPTEWDYTIDDFVLYPYGHFFSQKWMNKLMCRCITSSYSCYQHPQMWLMCQMSHATWPRAPCISVD